MRSREIPMPRVREVFDDIDERLFACLDDEDHLSIPIAAKALSYTEKLLAGEMTILELHDEWEDWHAVVEGFIFGYGLDEEEFGGLFNRVPLGGDDLTSPLTPADRAFLEPLTHWLSLHIDLRNEGESL